MSVNWRYLNRSWLSFASSCYTAEKSVFGVEEVRFSLNIQAKMRQETTERQTVSQYTTVCCTPQLLHVSPRFLFWKVFLEQRKQSGWFRCALIIEMANSDKETLGLEFQLYTALNLLVRVNLLLAFVFLAAWLWYYTKRSECCERKSVSHQTTQAGRSVLFNLSHAHNFAILLNFPDIL